MRTLLLSLWVAAVGARLPADCYLERYPDLNEHRGDAAALHAHYEQTGRAQGRTFACPPRAPLAESFEGSCADGFARRYDGFSATAAARAVCGRDRCTPRKFDDGVTSYSGPPWKECKRVEPAASDAGFDAGCRVTLANAAACLKAAGIDTIVFLGDSLTSQLFFSAGCEAAEAGTGNATFDLAEQMKTFHGLKMLRRWPPGPGASGGHMPVFREPGDEALAGENVLWLVNLGLHHLVCPARFHGKALHQLGLHQMSVAKFKEVDHHRRRDGAACVDQNYAEKVRIIFKELAARARGPLVWQDTTSIHMTREIFQSLDPPTRRKFRDFSNRHVKEINEIAERLLSEEFPAVHIHGLNYQTTVHSHDGLLAGDSRHYTGAVTRHRLELIYLTWCAVAAKVKSQSASAPFAPSARLRKKRKPKAGP